MTAQCMGNFGCHKWLYPQYLNDALREKYQLVRYSPNGYQTLSPSEEKSLSQYHHQANQDETIKGDSSETVWVNKRYIPTDLRSTAPVPRHKLLAPRKLPVTDRHWVPLGEASLRSISRSGEESQLFVSSTSTRSEEWSTLRQLLPSKGRPQRYRPPNWGTGLATPPLMIGTKQSRFPHINSPMTRYTDDMHLTNRLFKLH